MAFCSSCGSKINGTKFCPECGAPTAAGSAVASQRKQEYVGTIIKCANCGETMNSFAANCPSCGYELREARVSGAVSELARKLEALEATRKQGSGIGKFFGVSKVDEQKINLIQSFPIPNTKEDIIEFIILAGANIDSDALAGQADDPFAERKSKAWQSKCEQAYQKARLILSGSADFSEVKAIYDEIMNKNKKGKRKRARILVFGFGGLLVFCLLCSLPFMLGGKGTERKLEQLVEQVQVCIANEDYVTARIKASQIVDDSNWSSASEKKWDDVRKSLLAEIDKLEGKQPVEKVKIPIGLSPADMIGKNYKIVMEQLKKNGFTNVKTDVDAAIFSGLFRSGEVKEVTIEGRSDFTDESVYYPDAIIIITYY